MGRKRKNELETPEEARLNRNRRAKEKYNAKKSKQNQISDTSAPSTSFAVQLANEPTVAPSIQQPVVVPILRALSSIAITKRTRIPTETTEEPPSKRAKKNNPTAAESTSNNIALAKPQLKIPADQEPNKESISKSHVCS